MPTIENAAFNILPDGSVVLEGDHSPGTSGAAWPLLGIHAARLQVGEYLISGPGIAWPAGWRVTIFRDENDQNTVWVKLGTSAAGLTVSVRDIEDRTMPVDIVYMMTLRVSVLVDVVPLPAPAQVESADLDELVQDPPQ
ncbi:hypothetical protein FHR51_002573 [Xanthomonas arboricola]|uniref:hypothetical protein n=1 Tax=Xanthomonas cannabis TaxID=1885674 RepID=UPI00160D6574|nr:hypothetical protein [Xanthomonas cannabis]MBB3806421.1 hypothetical protein [Xanthomonas cannabis]